jgi:D-amino peptidase
MIEDGARAALQNLHRVKPYVPARPTRITVEIDTVDKASNFMGRYGVEFVEPLKVVSTGADWLQAWDQVWHW